MEALSCAAVPHMEVHYIFSVSPLHRDRKGLEWVEGEGNEAPDGVIDRPAQESCLDFKLQKARISGVEPAKDKERRVRSGTCDLLCSQQD